MSTTAKFKLFEHWQGGRAWSISFALPLGLVLVDSIAQGEKSRFSGWLIPAGFLELCLVTIVSRSAPILVLKSQP